MIIDLNIKNRFITAMNVINSAKNITSNNRVQYAKRNQPKKNILSSPLKMKLF